MKEIAYLFQLPPHRRWHYLYLASSLGVINSSCLMITLLSQPPFHSTPSGVWTGVYACGCVIFVASLISLMLSTLKLSLLK